MSFVDCLTFSDISPENLIVICEAQTPYYYDIESLARHFQVSKRMENPSTKVPLPLEVRIQVSKYLKKDIVAFRINFESDIYLQSSTLIGFALIEIATAATTSKDLKCLTRIQVICNSVSLYEYPLTNPVSVLGDNRRFNCIISHPTTPANLRKLLNFLKGFPTVRVSKILSAILEDELEFGTRTKI